MDNYQQVLLQMEDFGVEFKSEADKDFKFDTPKRKTFGKGGKYWYRLYLFRPDAGGCYIVGSYGTYRHGGDWRKVEVDWAPLSQAERHRMAAERAAKYAAAEAERLAEAEMAALDARDLWRRAVSKGVSPYLQRKHVDGESCKFLPDGTLVIPLLRYDLERHQALVAVQRILPDGRKFYSKGFEKPGVAVRLGPVALGPLSYEPPLFLVCEGYATGCTIRMAVEHWFPVFVAFDSGNLHHVVPLLRTLYPRTRILVCADDDWLTRDQHTGQLVNPGRTSALAIAKKVDGCDLVWPVFNPDLREARDTDFNDLHLREGLPAVREQLAGVVEAMVHLYG